MLVRLIQLVVLVGRFKKNLPHSPIVMMGFNLAVTTELYQRVNGFTTTDVNEDVELQNRILRLTTNGTYNRKMVVATSLRRLMHLGLFRTFRYYLNKGGF